jgi:hypothetical protein
MSKDSVAAAMAALMDSNLILASPALQLTQHVSHVSVEDLAQKDLALQGATIIIHSLRKDDHCSAKLLTEVITSVHKWVRSAHTGTEDDPYKQLRLG